MIWSLASLAFYRPSSLSAAVLRPLSIICPSGIYFSSLLLSSELIPSVLRSALFILSSLLLIVGKSLFLFPYKRRLCIWIICKICYPLVYANKSFRRSCWEKMWHFSYICKWCFKTIIVLHQLIIYKLLFVTKSPYINKCFYTQFSLSSLCVSAPSNCYRLTMTNKRAGGNDRIEILNQECKMLFLEPLKFLLRDQDCKSLIQR